MNPKERIYSVVRHCLSALGGYVFVKGLLSFGNNELIGIVLFVLAMILSWRAKVIMSDIINGILRHAVSFIGGYLLASSAFEISSLPTIHGLILIIGSLIISQLTPRNLNLVMITAANGDLYKIAEKAQPVINTGLPSSQGS